ncbi:MAG: hypothetical protein V4850_07810 [Myxococcota bacterium]
MLHIFVLLACAEAPTDTTPDPVVCGADYHQSDLEADIRGAYCEWQVECLGLFGDVPSCGDFVTDESILEDIDPCRLQTCAAWLTSAAYVCETKEAVETPDECGDPFL